MKFPIADILCIVVGLLVSVLLGQLFNVITKKYDLGTVRLLNGLPDWLGIIVMLLILLCIPFFCLNFTWAFIAYNYIVNGKLPLALLTFFINAIGTFYTAIITKDMHGK